MAFDSMQGKKRKRKKENEDPNAIFSVIIFSKKSGGRCPFHCDNFYSRDETFVVQLDCIEGNGFLCI